MKTLGEYLTFIGGRPWAWGMPFDDCCTFPSDWMIERGHADPMARWRGKYHDITTCSKIINESGGLLPLWRKALGNEQPLEPREGDVGVVTLNGFEAGAIFTGRRWAVRGGRGWAAASFDPDSVLGFWRVK